MNTPGYDATIAPLVSKAVSLFVNQPVADAATYIEGQGDPKQAARVYSETVNTIYREHRQVGPMLDAAERGLQYCLDKACALQTSAPETATELRNTAKLLSYNAANNCWPGWEDEGIAIAADHLQRAYTLSQESARLVEELGLGDMQTGNAAWLNGALAMARDQLQEASVQFGVAETAFQRAGERAYELMATTYGALVHWQQGASPTTRQALDAALAALREIGSEDAVFFAEQITGAERVFGRSNSAK